MSFSDRINESHLGMFAGRTNFARNPTIHSGTVFGQYYEQDQTLSQPLNQITARARAPQPVRYNPDSFSSARKSNMYYAYDSRPY